MTLNARTLLTALVDHALTLGVFDQANGHEPKTLPGTGLSLGVWANKLTPVAAMSGLNSTSVRAEFTAQMYKPILAEPADTIDPAVLDACDALMAAYTGDFTLGGLVEQVDLLGAHGDPLEAQAGYIQQQDATYRVMTISLPLIVDDLWQQEA